MKTFFVKTENHRRFMASVAMLENRGAIERCLLPVKGKPGVGKTRVVDHWASTVDAVFIEGVPGMSLRYLKDALKHESGVGVRGAFAEFEALVEFLRNEGGTPRPIILDECQHGFLKKAECIEYLRRMAEKAGSILVLVCHSSEAHLLDRYDHVRTRICCVADLLPPTPEDTALYSNELCEVTLDEALIAEVHKQSGARYRLISDALVNLERVAKKLGKTTLTLEDVKGMPLCQDWERALRVAPHKLANASVQGGKK